MIEAGAPVDDPTAFEFPGSRQQTPEEDFFRRKGEAILRSVIKLLPEPSRSVILGHELEGRWDSIKEMEQDLGLKNWSYELKKARDMLKAMMK